MGMKDYVYIENGDTVRFKDNTLTGKITRDGKIDWSRSTSEVFGIHMWNKFCAQRQGPPKEITPTKPCRLTLESLILAKGRTWNTPDIRRTNLQTFKFSRVRNQQIGLKGSITGFKKFKLLGNKLIEVNYPSLFAVLDSEGNLQWS